MQQIGCISKKYSEERRKQQAGQKRPPGGRLLHLQSEPRLDKSGSPGEEQGAEQQDALRDAGADLTGDVREHGGDHLQDDLDDRSRMMAILAGCPNALAKRASCSWVAVYSFFSSISLFVVRKSTNNWEYFQLFCLIFGWIG